MTSFEKWQIGISAGTLVAAILIGIWANSINDRLRQLQDYVAVSVIPGDSNIKLINTGKMNVYLWGFDMPGNPQRFDRGKLIPASSDYIYWIPVPDASKIDKKFDFKLYLTDQDGNKWVSDAGGEIVDIKNTNKGKIYTMNIWSYETYKNNWQLEIKN